MSEKIRITIIQNAAYIFHADGELIDNQILPLKTTIRNNNCILNTFPSPDYIRLRSKHRIVGHLVGCTAACPRNTTVHGLPAVLSAFELRLLLDLQLVEVCRTADASRPPDAALTVRYAAFRQRSLVEQQEHQRTCKLNESRKVIDRILAGKRQKLRASGASEAECARLTAEQVLEDIGKGSAAFNAENALVQMPTTSALGHTANEPPTPSSTAPATDAQEEAIAQAAAAPRQSLHMCVYRDLWQRGKYVTNGDSFGGDFLVYPGDPMLYHASHIVNCLQAPLECAELVAFGRMSVLVNKLCVLAYRSAADAEVEYQTLEWEGREAAIGLDDVTAI